MRERMRDTRDLRSGYTDRRLRSRGRPLPGRFPTPHQACCRLWTPAAGYHVLNRGLARETIFHDDADRLYFRDLVARYRDRFHLSIFHYCVSRIASPGAVACDFG
jgi:hypothetical protein